MYVTDHSSLGQYHKRSKHMPLRVPLLKARHLHPEGRATVRADKPLVVHEDSKKTVCARVFEFVILFLGQSSIHGLNHLVAEKRTLIER
jgi:hypothetical protein